MQPHLDDELEPAPAAAAHQDPPRPRRQADPAEGTDPATPEPAEDPDLAHAPAADAPMTRPERRPMASASTRPEREPEAAHAPEPAAPTTVAELSPRPFAPPASASRSRSRARASCPVLDALQAAGIRLVATRHEGAAAFAAEAYGQLTGRPAACLGTRAVGASNLAIGIHTATADSTPMFVLVGQVDRGLRGREAFQEVDLVETIGRLAKWAGEIDDPATAADTLEAAVRATVEGRPGPGAAQHAGGRPRPAAPRGHAGARSSARTPRSRTRPTSGRCSTSSPRRSARSSSPGPASCAPAARTTSSASPSSSTSRSSPRGAAAT